MNPINSEKTAGLYIHVPFCLSKCPYCDFYSETFLSAIPDFLKGLFKEMEGDHDPFERFDTVYIGGGTPSLLAPQQLERILMSVQKNFHLTSDAEFTIEVNPADLNPSFLRSLRGMGIHRINLGVQSFDERVLRFLGRRHTVNQAFSAMEASRKAGFDHMGLDLIDGVPMQGMDSWLNTLERALTFLPEHLSCYQLTIEAKTPLGKRYEKGEFFMPGEETQYQFFMMTSQFLEEAGYLHYEISNFAKGIEHRSRHNQKYWDHSPYLGLGPSAHSLFDDQRWWNDSSLDSYLDQIHQGRLPVEEKETLTLDQLRLETLFLGLRTKRGVDLENFKYRFACDLLMEKKHLLETLEEEGFLTICDGSIAPTRKGFAVADSLSLIG